MDLLSFISVNGTNYELADAQARQDNTGCYKDKGSITATTDLSAIDNGVYSVGVANDGFPVTGRIYGVLFQMGGTCKVQVLIAGSSSSCKMYIRRYLTSSSSWTDWAVQGA